MRPPLLIMIKHRSLSILRSFADSFIFAKGFFFSLNARYEKFSSITALFASLRLSRLLSHRRYFFCKAGRSGRQVLVMIFMLIYSSRLTNEVKMLKQKKFARWLIFTCFEATGKFTEWMKTVAFMVWMEFLRCLKRF